MIPIRWGGPELTPTILPLPFMFETLLQLDNDILLAVNGLHCEFFDYFMRECSRKFVWIPFYAAIFVLLCSRFTLKTSILALLSIALPITLCDQLSASLLRPMVGRLRPANPDNPLSQWVHVVNNYRSGRHGFPSSHAANTAGLTFFCIRLFRRRFLSWLFVGWMLLVCYSRIYLGVHYLGDLMAGMLLGFVVATLAYWAFSAMTRRLQLTTEQRSTPYDRYFLALPPAAFLLVVAWMLLWATVHL